MDTEENITTDRNDIALKIVTGELQLHDKLTCRSRIWRQFSRVTNREGVELDFVCCKTCQRIYKYNHSQTSNLCRHSCYVEKFATAENEVSIVEEEKPKLQAMEVTVDSLTQLLTKWLIQSCLSSDVIQNDGLQAVFEELVKLGAKTGGDFDMGKLLPSLSEVSDNISDVYNRLFVSLKEEISSIKENGFGLTADILTDTLSQGNYLSLTIHYLKNGVLTYRLLGFHMVGGQSTSNAAASVKRILEKFDLQLSKKCIFVTDGSIDITKTFQDSQTLPCMSRLLNNAILKAVERVVQVSQIIDSCFEMVNFSRQNVSSALSSKLSYKSHRNHSLTIYEMLTSLLCHFNDIDQVPQDMQEYKNFSNRAELVAIINVLQPFEEAMATLEDDSGAALHLVMAYMHELRKLCEKAGDDDYKCFPCVQELAHNISLNLEDIVRNNIATLHKVAVFLYPPTNKLLPYSAKEKQYIEEECMRLLKYYKSETEPMIKQEEPDEGQTVVVSFCKRRKLLRDFLDSESDCDINVIIRQEMQNYKNTRTVFSPSFNVFNWWESQKDNFPLLYKLSCTVLATPATSAPAKRVFSNAASLLNNKYRANPAPDDTEKTVFISTNASGLELERYFSS